MLEKCKIIVEGRKGNLDYQVIEKLTKKFAKKYKLDINIEPSGSYSEVYKFLETLAKLSRTNLKYLLIIVDADEESIEERFKEIKSKFIENNFNVPIKLGDINYDDPKKINLGIFLLPDNKNKGSMDTLVYSALEKNTEKFKDCVKLYRECFKKNGLLKGTESQKDKFGLRSIMAGLIYKNERQTKFINFENKNFEALKKFLGQVK